MGTMKYNDEESETLEAILDVLLPKLLCGELRVGPNKELIGINGT